MVQKFSIKLENSHLFFLGLVGVFVLFLLYIQEDEEKYCYGDEESDENKFTAYNELIKINEEDYGVTVELDQKVYTWTDKIYITIVAPSYNFDSKILDVVGNQTTSKFTIKSSISQLEHYSLVETGTDTGIFTGEIILTGFEYDADGDSSTGWNGYDVCSRTFPKINGGPTNGLLEIMNDDTVTAVFEVHDYSETAEAKTRWNVGEVQWLNALYNVNEVGIIRVVDPDMNLEPETINQFRIHVWSDSNLEGIFLNVTETNEATGIFEASVPLQTGDKLTKDGIKADFSDTIYAAYIDFTLPSPYGIDEYLIVNGTSQMEPLVFPKIHLVDFKN